MEAQRLNTVDDLLRFPEERVELINGEIVQRPMARSEHALVQVGISDEVSLLRRKDGPGGWWIMTEISVRYGEYQCPSHDLAGWRKERVPNRPTGIMDIKRWPRKSEQSAKWINCSLTAWATPIDWSIR